MNQTVLVYGALRSGTTLLRLMLDSHPKIANPGEFDFLFDHLDQADEGSFHYDLISLSEDRIFCDFESLRHEPRSENPTPQSFLDEIFKECSKPIRAINIHRNLDVALKVLKDVKIVHIVRHPMSVADSSKRMGWGANLYTSVAHWVETEKLWIEANLPQNCFCEVRFEELLMNPREQLQRICHFLGVEFDQEMLSYHVRTSYQRPNQSRAEAITQGGDWTLPFAEWRCLAQLTALGYRPVSTPIAPSRIQRVFANIESKARSFVFNCRRYGFKLAIAKRFVRRLRPSPIKAEIIKRIHSVERMHLK